jgi:hypothetical protein
MLNWHSEISRKFDQCLKLNVNPTNQSHEDIKILIGISILDVVQTLGATWATNVFPFSRQPCNLAGHFLGAIALYRSWFLAFRPRNYWRTKRFHIRWVVHPHICWFISPCSMGTTSTTPPVSFFMLFCQIHWLIISFPLKWTFGGISHVQTAYPNMVGYISPILSPIYPLRCIH